MAPIKSTKFGYMSIFTDKVETDNNIAGIGATYSTSEVFEPGNGYRYLIYTTPGYLNVNRGGSVDLLIVGGGGAGGNGEYLPPNHYAGAGGGAGGYFQDFNFTLPIGEYDISIGSGGAIAPTPGDAQPGNFRNGNPGTPSYISGPGITTIIAYGGGGGGGGYDFSPGPTPIPGGSGSDGGSGGGVAYILSPDRVGHGNSTTASAPTLGSPIPTYLQGSGEVQGYPGGPEPGSTFTGSGGGGAGGAGGGPQPHLGGIGRPAWTNDAGIPPSYGTPGPTPGRWFAGGGGGGHRYLAPSSPPYNWENGGAGGGGQGGDALPPDTQASTSGTTNTGGGGGGGSGTARLASAGGSGIVIVRYKIS